MRLNTPPSELRTALGALAPYLRRAMLFSLVCAVLVLAPSVYMLEVYDRVVNSRSVMTLAMLTLLVLAVYALMEVLEWVRSEVLLEASMELEHKLGPRIFQAVFDAQLRRAGAGTTVQPLHDFRTLRDFLTSPAVLAVMETPMALITLAALYLISPFLALAALLAAVVQSLLTWLNERSTHPLLMAANRGAMSAQQYADGTLRNAEVIESMGMLRDIHARWMQRQRNFLTQQAMASDHAGFYQALSRLIQNAVSSGLLGLGAWLLLLNELHGGPSFMIVGSILGGRVLAPLVQVVMQWQVVVGAREAYARLDDMLKNVPKPARGMPLPAPRGLLQVEPLHGGAPGSPQHILRGVSFALNPGEAVAVVGPSACGKTTLARMLVGLWPSMGGKVRLDGVDVFTWSKTELGPYIGYLPQDVELFDGTVAENIARFGGVDVDQVRAAARQVGLEATIDALPQGFDTRIGPDGAILSGGQRQRVGLARALYRQPRFVVLDEPNSSLDDEGDAALAQAIAQAKASGTTFVIITHRTSVLGVVEKMLVLRDGMTQMWGPRDEVLKALAEAAAKARQVVPVAA